MGSLLILIMMQMGQHGVNIFDETPYEEQIKRPNCIIDNNKYNSQTGKWEYGPYKYCIDENGNWSEKPTPKYGPGSVNYRGNE